MIDALASRILGRILGGRSSITMSTEVAGDDWYHGFVRALREKLRLMCKFYTAGHGEIDQQQSCTRFALDIPSRSGILSIAY